MMLNSVLFMLCLAAALFFCRWRGTLFFLTVQVWLLAYWLLSHQTEIETSTVFQLLDLWVLRGILAPVMLWRALGHWDAPHPVDMLPTNLFLWCVAACVGVSAFWGALQLEPRDLPQLITVGACFSQVLLGMLALVHQRQRPGQVMALLIIENGVLLFELTGPEHPAWELQLGLSAVFLGLVFLLSLAPQDSLHGDMGATTSGSGKTLQEVL